MMSDPDQLFPVSLFYLMRTRKIGDYAFYSANLKHDYKDTGGAYMILERVKSIGQYAFYNTDIMDATIYYYKKLPDVYENSFSDWTYENCDLTLYYTEEDDYRMHPVWSKFKKVKSEYWSKVEDIEQEPDVDIEIIGNMIHIDGIRSGSRVELYDLSGRCIKSCTNCSEGELNIQIDFPGVYICKVNNEIKKVMIH